MEQKIECSCINSGNGVDARSGKTRCRASLFILTKLGNQIYAKTYHPFEIYISLGVLYFVMTYSMTFVARKLERKATKWQ